MGCGSISLLFPMRPPLTSLPLYTVESTDSPVGILWHHTSREEETTILVLGGSGCPGSPNITNTTGDLDVHTQRGWMFQLLTEQGLTQIRGIIFIYNMKSGSTASQGPRFLMSFYPTALSRWSCFIVTGGKVKEKQRAWKFHKWLPFTSCLF